MSGIFASILGAETRSTGYEVVVESMAANREAAGGIVNETSAMKLSAVFGCVRILAETLGSLPLIIYEETAAGKRRAKNHYLYKLLHDRPNDLMTDFEFRETVQGHLALWGNAYIQTDYNARGQVTSLWPLLPNMVHLTRRDGSMRYYYYQLPNGQMQWLSSNVIWHLRGLGGDGLNGYSVIGFARRNLQGGINADEYQNRFYENDARPGIVLEHPGELKDEAHTKLKKSWKESHEGVDRAHRVAILEEGMKLHEVGIPPVDAQFVQSRSFSVVDVCRWFRMQPHKVMHLENATFSNIEHQSIEHVVDTIQPWARRWERSVNQNLLLERDRSRYYAEFLLDALLRGDTESRYAAYAQGKQWGWLSTNDIRRLENMNPVPGGDIYMVPLNMVPATQAGQQLEGNNRGQEARGHVENRTATMRLRLRGAYLGIYRDTAQRILRRESNDILRQVKKMARQMDSGGFLIWLEDFEREHADFIKRAMMPVNGSYGEAVVAEALEEIGEDFDISPEITRFIDSYTGGYSARHTGISLDLIRQAIRQAQNDQKPIEDAIEEELGTWQDGRGNMIAEEESTRFNNAVAKTIFAIYGIRKLRSVAFGDSCPYCKALNGKVVGIKQYFMSAGEELQPEGVEIPLTTTTNIGHPPYHGGCDCMIVAEV